MSDDRPRILQTASGNLANAAASQLIMRRLQRISLLITIALLVAAPSFGEPKEWRIDNSHSYVGFKVRHLMVSWVRGKFNDVKGTVVHDPDDPSKTKVEVVIDASSIDTSNERRDTDLRSAQFFDVEKHPEIRFVSKRVTGNAQDGFKLVGDLTLHGVTKEMTLAVEGPAPAVSDGRGAEKSGVSATGKINRSDFGLTWNRALEAGGVTVGDEVIIEIEAELARGGPERKAAE